MGASDKSQLDDCILTRKSSRLVDHYHLLHVIRNQRHTFMAEGDPFMRHVYIAHFFNFNHIRFLQNPHKIAKRIIFFIQSFDFIFQFNVYRLENFSPFSSLFFLESLDIKIRQLIILTVFFFYTFSCGNSFLPVQKIDEKLFRCPFPRVRVDLVSINRQPRFLFISHPRIASFPCATVSFASVEPRERILAQFHVDHQDRQKSQRIF